MAKISVTDFKAGVDQVETEATRRATELADKEYEAEYQHLEAEAINAARSFAAAKTVNEFKGTDLHDHAIFGWVIGPGQRESASQIPGILAEA